MSNAIIKIQNLSLEISGFKILENINLEINEGEINTIIGLNGSGKTTLLKTILGVYKPSSGSIEINTKKIAYVPQKLHFDKTIPISVYELLQIYSGKNQIDILAKLKEVKADKLTNKKVGVLSGGELQRVLIANALLLEPKLLLLDEATAGIDIVGEKDFYDLIEKIHTEYKITIIMVSHDIHTVFAASDKIFCINKHICCSGKPAEVSQDTQFKKLFGHNLAPFSHKHDHHHH